MRITSRISHAVGLGIGVLAISCLASAQGRPSLSTFQGPQQAPAFWIHDDGTVEVNDRSGQLFFASIDDYVGSDWFRDNGRRCGLPPVDERPIGEPIDPFEGGVAGGSSNDCSCSRTNPSAIYEPVNGPVYRIPVVVHVIQNSAGTQGFISEACVQDQILTLNEDFNALSGSPGAPGNDARIEFFLATEDPQGNPTNGITYSQNSTWFNDGGAYYNSLAWNTREYLNIYTNSASGALGYVPALGCSNIDGQAQDRVVILYSAFGNCATSSPYTGGRTATHEIGHYLGLEHTFSGGCASASNCYQNGDLICDTNPEAQPNYTGCTQTSCGTPDPARNYMDYSQDSCMNNFTPEQNARMRCILDHYRVQLPCDDCGVAPENDECSGALALVEGPNEFTSVGATTSGVDAPLSCSTTSGPDVLNDVWFTWTAPGNGFLALGTCSSPFDTRIVVHNGGSCPTNGSSVLACSDNDCGDDAVLSTLVFEGQQLVVQVGSPDDQSGTFTLDLQFDEITNPPANDDCGNAIAVEVGTTEFTTVDATGSGFDDPLSCSTSTGGQVFADVWFSWTAPCTGFATIGTCGSSFDSRFSVYVGGCPSGPTNALLCGDSGCGDDSSGQSLVVEGQQLLIRVGSPFEGQEGDGVLTIDCVPIGGDPCPEDLNDDGSVDSADLGLAIAAWGTDDAAADLNDDGVVDSADIGLLIAAWGDC